MSGSPSDDELRLQMWQQAIETYRSNRALMLQGWSFLAAADVGLLGFGFSQHDAGVLLLATLGPATMIATVVDNQRHIVPHVYLAMVIEQELGLADRGVMHTLIRSSQHTLWKVMQRVLATTDEQERIKSLRRHVRFRTTLAGPDPRYLYVIVGLQVTLAVVCWSALGYAFFTKGA